MFPCRNINGLTASSHPSCGSRANTDGAAWLRYETSSGSDDPGAAAGWSIPSVSRYRIWNTPSWSTDSTSLIFAIHGYAKNTGIPATPQSPASEAQQRVVKRTLAAVASRTVAGAVANIGTRLDDAAPSPGLSLAGETVQFGGSGAAGPDDAWPPGGSESRGMEAGNLLGSSAFSYTLGAAEGDKKSDPMAPRWAVWGRGDFGSFSGRPDGISSYRGETRTGWLGIDASSGRWVAGLALSRGTSKTDYVLDGEEGRIQGNRISLFRR